MHDPAVTTQSGEFIAHMYRPANCSQQSAVWPMANSVSTSKDYTLGDKIVL